MGLKHSWLVVPSLLFPHTEVGFCRFLGPSLHPQRWILVICLIELPFSWICWVSRPFWNWPSWHILFQAGVAGIFRVIWPGSYNLWCRVHQDERIKSLHCPSSVQTELGRSFGLWLNDWIIFRSWGHLVLLLVNWKPGGSSETSAPQMLPSYFICLVSVKLTNWMITSMSFRK